MSQPVTIEERILSIIKHEASPTPEGIDTTSLFVDFMDSLDCISVIMAVEDSFDIEIPDDDVEKLKTIKDLV